jgi:murein DD-endopeptidase MepM/ murein hydrolase activator NlpD
MQLSTPAPGRPVTSPYGWRIHPITKKRSFHRGTDFGGTFDVLAAGDGTVVYVAPDWASLTKAQKAKQSGGNVVTIQHQRDLFTTYYHGAARTNLKVGQEVKAGDLIYRSGQTGAATGPHLHFEVRTKQSWGSDVSPDSYFVDPQPVKVTVDGIMGKETWRAIQTILRKEKYYPGAIDGIPGKITVSALQKYINDGKF